MNNIIDLHKSNLQFVSLIEYIRSKLSFLVAHVTAASVWAPYICLWT